MVSATLAAPTGAPVDQDLKNIQGNIAPGFSKDNQAFVLVNFPATAPAKAWLRELRASIASAEEVLEFKNLFKLVGNRRPDEETGVVCSTWVNVAFSWAGLAIFEGDRLG